jgi:hypothetical protein
MKARLRGHGFFLSIRATKPLSLIKLFGVKLQRDLFLAILPDRRKKR